MDGKLRIKLNGRELTLVDAEHAACKIYLVLNRRSGVNGLASAKPDRPHLWPMCWDAQLNKGLLEIARAVLESYKGLAMKENGGLRVPLIFQQRNESDADWTETDGDGEEEEANDVQLVHGMVVKEGVLTL